MSSETGNHIYIDDPPQKNWFRGKKKTNMSVSQSFRSISHIWDSHLEILFHPQNPNDSLSYLSFSFPNIQVNFGFYLCQIQYLNNNVCLIVSGIKIHSFFLICNRVIHSQIRIISCICIMHQIILFLILFYLLYLHIICMPSISIYLWSHHMNVNHNVHVKINLAPFPAKSSIFRALQSLN